MIFRDIISGTKSSEEAWMAKDKDKKFLRGFNFYQADKWTPQLFEQLVKEGKVGV
jgi:hypothetical protein